MNTPHISIPGSKSYTNRALIMAALTRGPVTITNQLESDDIDAMVSCLQTLGIEITKTPDAITVYNSLFDLSARDPSLATTLDCRQSGTTYRFLIPVACLIPGTHVITGERRLTQRPIKELIVALQQIGFDIDYSLDAEGCQKIVVHGRDMFRRHSELTSSHIKPTVCHPERSEGSHTLKHSVSIPGTISSQYISALLMIAPLLPEGFRVDIEGELISKPYVDMTTSMMGEWGVSVANDKYTSISVPPREYQLSGKSYTVEGDYSAAGYFFAIAALHKKELLLENLHPHSKQGDKQFMEFLIDTGCVTCHFDSSSQAGVASSVGYTRRERSQNTQLRVVGRGIHPVTVNMEDFPDQAQTLAVLVAFAPGVSTLTGVRSLRLKETERVVAIQTELAKMGIHTESPDVDTLVIHGGVPHGAEIDTYKDHRMAMSFSIAKTMLPDLIIHHPEVVRKTFPRFWDEWQKCGS